MIIFHPYDSLLGLLLFWEKIVLTIFINVMSFGCWIKVWNIYIVKKRINYKTYPINVNVYRFKLIEIVKNFIHLFSWPWQAFMFDTTTFDFMDKSLLIFISFRNDEPCLRISSKGSFVKDLINLSPISSLLSRL